MRSRCVRSGAQIIVMIGQTRGEQQLDGARDILMEQLAPLAQDGAVGDFLGQRVVEIVFDSPACGSS